jgi:HlyD family secretion protein
MFRRYGRWLFLLLLVAGLLAVALWPRRQPVDVARVTRGPLMVTIDEEGETRVRRRFVVSTPVAGRVQRIDLEPGDRVERGRTIVARVLPEAPGLLDARTRGELEAAVTAARTALGGARADEQRARTALDLARTELDRMRELVQSGVGTRQQLDSREAEARTAEDQVQAATFATATAQAEVDRAVARLRPATAPAPGDANRAVSIPSPVDGVVLKRLRESESVVPAGDPLVEIGDPHNLEIVSDLLSTDAVRVPPNARVLVVDWGGTEPLEARVRRVEPSGFTKVSALGVEEQRVNVTMDFVNPSEVWSRLGDGYRVSVRVVTWESKDALQVPTSALFRQGEAWAVYVVDGGRARRVPVEIGHRTAQAAEVVRGVSEGAVVIVHPGDTLQDGARIEPRAGT